MEQTFTNFLAALRGADVRVSVAETLDALETAELVGWRDRAMLKDALSLALAKTQEEKQAFDACFDQFFRSDSFRGSSEEHTSELQSLMRISYAAFCLTKNKKKNRSITRSVEQHKR